jgi:hypothetical protein
LDIEFDTIELARGCAHRCLHCSESPETKVVFANLADIRRGVDKITALEAHLKRRLWARYWLPFPASEPLDSAILPDVCALLYNQSEVPAYILTKAPDHPRSRQIVANLLSMPSAIFRFGITISNFSAEAQGNISRHARAVANMMKLLKPLWDALGPDGRPLLFVTPQFVENADASEHCSRIKTFETLNFIADIAGWDSSEWSHSGRVIERAVVALGRASTHLGVTRDDVVTLSPETCAHEITLKPELEWSGMVSLEGSLEQIRMPRGQLGRHRSLWEKLNDDSLGFEPIQRYQNLSSTVSPR